MVFSKFSLEYFSSLELHPFKFYNTYQHGIRSIDIRTVDFSLVKTNRQYLKSIEMINFKEVVL